MLKFGEFIAECGGYNAPVVSISKDKVNLSDIGTRNEINRNLAAELSIAWVNPYSAWLKVSKVLSFYGIALPRTVFLDAEEGDEIVELRQFGNVVGAKVDGSINMHPEDPEYFLYFNYGIGEKGFYEVFASVVDEDGLNDYVEFDQQSDDIESPEGQKDPRQP